MSPPEATDPATRSRAGEDTALLATQDEAPQSKVAQIGVILAACLAYIILSSCLINYNKFLMHSDYFPYSMALTALHMFTSTTMCSLVYLIGGQKWLPGMATVKLSPDGYMKKLIPLSIFFAASICLSNEAYIYCSVPFLQMCKELNVVMVYFVGLALAVERFNVQTTTVLFIIMCGCCMSIHGEMRFSATGFLLQLTAQSAEVLKIIMQQKIMQAEDAQQKAAAKSDLTEKKLQEAEAKVKQTGEKLEQALKKEADTDSQLQEAHRQASLEALQHKEDLWVVVKTQKCSRKTCQRLRLMH